MNFFEKKYQLFISSTYQDLIIGREEVIKSILSLYHIPIGMEMFSADNSDQWEVIQHTIDNSDYYLLILGHRYGSVTKEGISFTEKEFDYAKSIGIPVLAFIRNHDVATKPEERDIEYDKQEKMRLFREKVSTGAMVDFWKNENELAQKVAIAITKIFSKTPRIGWVRADKAVSPQVSEELAQLSKENRDLKNIVEEFRKRESGLTPNFKMLINNKEQLEIEYKDPTFNHYELITPIDVDDIAEAFDLSGRTPKKIPNSSSNKVIEQYNLKIREFSNDVEKYNNSVKRQEIRVKNNLRTRISIHNIGMKKAKDVYIEISFPEEIMITRERPKKEKKTKPASIPNHPYEIKSSFITLPWSHDTVMHRPEPSNFTIDENLLTIRFDSILHTTQEESQGELYLVFLNKGTFTIPVSFMCEEFTTPELSTFEIIVE